MVTKSAIKCKNKGINLLGFHLLKELSQDVGLNPHNLNFK